MQWRTMHIRAHVNLRGVPRTSYMECGAGGRVSRWSLTMRSREGVMTYNLVVQMYNQTSQFLLVSIIFNIHTILWHIFLQLLYTAAPATSLSYSMCSTSSSRAHKYNTQYALCRVSFSLAITLSLYILVQIVVGVVHAWVGQNVTFCTFKHYARR